ncbi:SPOR domain-containing protein [Dyella sp.]|uniref:SPOR domain-containing protein n=1 Tax=Dyella sp. TaxID=1869338 RepID=UPI002D7710C3|nr:SPOR domain-containing protein [Dyella sp.]HET6432990.1 SPOR domain-containing protein [Dyella sp.]
MFLRLLFVLLVALNIAVGAWLVLGQDDAHVRSVADPGVPVLHLLTERPDLADPGAATAASAVDSGRADAVVPGESSTSAAAAVDEGSGAAGSRCVALGPFASLQALRSARAALAGESARSRSRQEQSQQSRGWWVYLPAESSRPAALAQAQRLADAGITDYFVVSSGDQPNTISLGLFKDPANARKRRDQLQAAGFTAQMSERVESVPEYWLDLVAATGDGTRLQSRLKTLGVGSHSTGCF